VQETRGWDEVAQETFSQRKKENAHDYRYFPDPDLPKLYLRKLFDIDAIKKSIPELPKGKRVRYVDTVGVKSDNADIIIDSPLLTTFFDTVIAGKDATFAQLASNYLVSDVLGLLNKDGKEVTKDNLPTTDAFTSLITMTEKGELSSRGAKDLLPFLLADKSADAKKLAEEKGLIQKNDPELLKKIVAEVIAENTKQVEEYKSGKESMFMFFVGQCMKKSKGAGNPQLFQELLKSELSK
jgi:aspartyl-tRNA(Asn)/glutamyl-tRNA(Gln) amidotransferase subunit B